MSEQRAFYSVRLTRYWYDGPGHDMRFNSEIKRVKHFTSRKQAEKLMCSVIDKYGGLLPYPVTEKEKELGMLFCYKTTSVHGEFRGYYLELIENKLESDE